MARVAAASKRKRGKKVKNISDTQNFIRVISKAGKLSRYASQKTGAAILINEKAMDRDEFCAYLVGVASGLAATIKYRKLRDKLYEAASLVIGTHGHTLQHVSDMKAAEKNCSPGG
jgi:hypothetical protein